MKKLLALSALALLMNTSFAATSAAKKVGRKVAQEAIKCTEDVEGQISVAPGCHEAINVAEACAWGSSRDVSITAAAQKVCDNKELKKISKADTGLLKQMQTRCQSACNPRTDGTMCISQISFCSLTATQFIASFYYEM